MALHGSASANLSPILFKGNNRALGVNVLIHQDESGSMGNLIAFYGDGTFIGSLQDALLDEKIGDDLVRYPNLYAYFGVYSRNPSQSFTINNPNGSLLINQSFIRGESTGSQTISRWVGLNYFNNRSSHIVNICTDLVGNTTGGRLAGYGNETSGGSPKSEDVHGNLWSVWTTPNAISTGTPGRFGSILGSDVRKGSATIIITNSDEQQNSPGDMINQLVDVDPTTIFYENYPGLAARRYSGYFSPLSGGTDFDNTTDNVNYTDNLTPVEGPIYVTEFNNFFAGNVGIYNNTTWSIFGYFLAPATGTYTFYTNSDDGSYLWIGNTALSGYTKENALVNNGGRHTSTERSGSTSLVAGTYYPIRILYGNQNLSTINPTQLTVSFSGPGVTKRTNGNGYFFSKNVSVNIPQERTINGPTGEMIFRKYRVIALSNYISTDIYDGVLFYGSTSNLPYGYVKFTSDSTYTITKSSIAPNWTPTTNRQNSRQLHDTLTLARETRGALFKIFNVFNPNVNPDDRRIAFSKCLAAFIADTV